MILNSMDHDLNPFGDWATVVDCGDISNTPFDKLVAIHELEKGMKAMNSRKPKNDSVADATRFITIGGDHTISKVSCFFPLSESDLGQHYQSSALCTQLGERLQSCISTPTSIPGIPNSLVVD